MKKPFHKGHTWGFFNFFYFLALVESLAAFGGYFLCITLVVVVFESQKSQVALQKPFEERILGSY